MVANHRGGGVSLVVVTTLLYCFISTRAGQLQRPWSHGPTNFLCFFTASTLTRELSQFDYRFLIGSKEPIIDYGKNSIFTSLMLCLINTLNCITVNCRHTCSLMGIFIFWFKQCVRLAEQQVGFPCNKFHYSLITFISSLTHSITSTISTRANIYNKH